MDKSRSNSKQKVETKQVDLDTGMPDLPKKELFAITFAFLGINMAFSLQSSQMSRICQTIGANPNNLGFFFIFPPLMGMIVQPIMERCQIGHGIALVVGCPTYYLGLQLRH